MTNSTDLEELAALDAVGVLDAAEQAELRERLSVAPAEVRAAVATLYEAAGHLAISGGPAADLPEPPARVRERLLARLARPANFSVGTEDGEWLETPIAGIVMKLLSLDIERDSAVMLLRAQPGTSYPAHHHTKAEECFVVSGDVTVQGRTLHAGGFHHAEPDTDHDPLSTQFGAEVLLVVSARDYGLI